VLNATRAQMLLLKGLGMPTKQSPLLRPWMFACRLEFGLQNFKILNPDFHLYRNLFK